MPENVAQATLKVQVTGANQGSNSIRGFQETVTRSMTASEKSVASAIGGMIAQYASLAVAVRQAAKVMSSGVEFNKFVENQTMSFSVMMKSMSAAKEQMKSLYDFAVNSPLTFKETAGSAKQLMAYGFAAKELVPTMKTLGSVAIATGNSLDDISYVYGTLRSQGRAYSRDLMQFGMRGIPIYEELAKVLGVNADQIQKMASQGKIGFKEVEQAFINMTSEGGRFSGILEGYMDTLTGKMSMLSDIAEQSAGKLMIGVNDALKTGVERLTTLFGSEYFQNFISDLSRGMSNIAAVLGTIITGFITLLPILSKLLVIWVAFGAVQLWFKLPSILLSAAAGITALTAGTMTATSASVGLGWAWDKVLTSITASSGAMMSLMGPVALVAVAIGGISSAMKEVQRTAKMIKDKEYFTQEIVKQAKGATSGGMGVSLDRFSVKDQIFYVEKMAEKYKQSKDEIAQILYFEKLITAESANALGFNVDNWVAQQKNAQWAQKTADAMSDRKFISTLKAVGLEISQWDSYVQDVQKSAEFMADPKAFEGIASLAEPSLDWKETEILKTLPSLDIVNEMIKAGANKTITDAATKEVLSAKVDTLQTYLTQLIERDMANPDDQNPALKAWLAKQLNMAQKLLDGLGKKSKETAKDLGTWWPPIVKAAEATLTAMDNIDVSMRQSIENAQKEYDERRKQLLINMDLAGSDKERYNILVDLLSLDADRLRLMQLITEESKKQANLAMYNAALGGSDSYWTNMQANAGGAYGSGNYAGGAGRQFVAQTMQGSEFGNIQSAVGAEGAGAAIPSIIAQAVTAFTSMILSIENVSKVLNPFKTIFEAVKVIIEPLLNNSLKPLVQIFTQFGTVLGQILTPFIGLGKIVNALTYAVLTPLMGVLNIFGGMLEWVYNSAIVPLGNGIISVINLFIAGINGFIKGINWAFRWAGVHINTLEYIDTIQKTTDALANMGESIDNQKNALSDTITYLTNKINSAIEKQLRSLQDLYEVGAISASDYSAQAEMLNLQKIVDQGNVSAEDMALTGQDIYSRLYTLYGVQDALNSSNLTEQQIAKLLTDARLSPESAEARMQRAVASAAQAYASANAVALGPLLSPNIPESAPPTVVTSIPEGISNATDQVSDAFTETQRGFFENLPIIGGWFDSGTSNIPYDMNARVHKGEGIVPATFMDSIRSGELSLSGGKDEPYGQNVNVYVTVEGSVQAENDLADSIANKIYVRRSTGVLTV